MNTAVDLPQELIECAETVSDALDADIIVYSGELFPPFDEKFVLRCNEPPIHPNVILLLSTFGGQANQAFRVARALQRRYPNGTFTVFVRRYCKSAGTLLVLGADELVMSAQAELGPLDVQLGKPDELGEVTSGLTPTQALATLREQSFSHFESAFMKLRFKSGLQISTKSAADIASQMAVGLFKPVYEQIDPMRLGEIDRHNRIAIGYGERLAKGNLKDDTIVRLVADYPSHDFVIDREEARQLFRSLRGPTDEEVALADVLESAMSRGIRGDSPFVCFLTERLAKLSHDEDGVKDGGREDVGKDDGESPSVEASERQEDSREDGETGEVADRSTKDHHRSRKRGSTKTPDDKIRLVSD